MRTTFVARIRAFTASARHKGVEERNQPAKRQGVTAPAREDGRLRPYVFAGYVAAALLALPALAHGPADWIMQGQHKNAAGEWCCGESDCFVVTGVATVTTPAPGYLIVGTGEFIPQSEAQPSPDGQFWRCKRPDGSRRCFFAPPPNS